ASLSVSFSRRAPDLHSCPTRRSSDLVGALPGLSWLGRGFWLDTRAAGGGPDAASGAVGSPGSSLPCEWSMSGPLALCSVGRDELPELERQLDDWGRPLAEEQWDELRVVWGVPDFERDFFPVDKPHEASLERRAVDWKKGCYLGQEVVCMQDMRGKV